MRKNNYLKLLVILLFVFILTSCTNKTKDETLSVALPSGAPSLSSIYITKEEKDGNNKTKTDILNDSSVIKASLINETYDLIVAPANLGAQIYNQNKSYYMLSGITFGNLYLVSKDEIRSLSDLNNYNFISFGKGSITDSVSTYILKENNITTNISYLTSAADTKTSFVSSNKEKEVYLLAEPLFSALKDNFTKSNKPFYYISIQEEWKKLTNLDGFLQAALFVKKDTYLNKRDLVDDYLKRLEESINNINNKDLISKNNKIIKDLGYFNFTDEVMYSATIGSNIKFITKDNLKEIFNKTYSLNLSLIGGRIPDEEFFK